MTSSRATCASDDAGDVFTIPANIEKTFDQISNAVAHVAATGSFPLILGGDHSIGFPTVRGIASVTSKRIGIIHIDRHADIQEKDLDERMHTTPYFARDARSRTCAPRTSCRSGSAGWQVPRAAVPIMLQRRTNVFSIADVEDLGVAKVVEMALERAWDGCDAVYLSFDIDSIEPGFVPGTGWPERGGLMPREALKMVSSSPRRGCAAWRSSKSRRRTTTPTSRASWRCASASTSSARSSRTARWARTSRSSTSRSCRSERRCRPFEPICAAAIFFSYGRGVLRM